MFETISDWSDIKEVLDRVTHPALYIDYSKVTLHTPISDIEVFSIVDIDVENNYAKNYGPVISVSIRMEARQWINDFYRHVDNMEMTLGSIRYKAIVNTDTLLNIEALNMDSMTDLELDRVGMLDITFQLLDRSLEALRYVTVGGIYKNVNIETLLSTVLYDGSKSVNVDGTSAIDHIRISPISNERIYKNIVIPHGTRLIDFPSYLQKRYGVYSTGIGFYIHNRIMYIYPVFNTNIKDSGKKTLRVLLYSSPIAEVSDSGVYISGDVVTVVGIGNNSTLDRKDAKMISNGNGVYYPETFSMMKKPVDISKGNPTGVRNRINNEFVHMDRQDGGNYTPRPSEDNLLEEMSRRAEDFINVVPVKVNNFYPDMIEPGMHVELIRKTGVGKISSTRATLLNIMTYIGKNSNPITTIYLGV